MSDSVIIISIVALTSLGITGIVSISTYFKDKIEFKMKHKVNGMVEQETAVASENTKK